MAQISLAKLMKLRNRLAGKMNKLRKEITERNSVPEGGTPIETGFYLRRYQDMMTAMILLKDVRHNANSAICTLVHALAEKKMFLAWLSALDCTEGPKLTTYREALVSYKSSMNTVAKDALIHTVEQEVANLQDEVDARNATIMVAIDEDTLALIQ
jgi:glutamate/tyrosine decarboxylase-like PLP-dependent enzyme